MLPNLQSYRSEAALSINVVNTSTLHVVVVVLHTVYAFNNRTLNSTRVAFARFLLVVCSASILLFCFCFLFLLVWVELMARRAENLLGFWPVCSP